MIQCNDLWLVAELFEQSDLIDVGLSDILIDVLQVDLLQGICLVVGLTNNLEHLMIHVKLL